MHFRQTPLILVRITQIVPEIPTHSVVKVQIISRAGVVPVLQITFDGARHLVPFEPYAFLLNGKVVAGGGQFPIPWIGVSM